MRFDLWKYLGIPLNWNNQKFSWVRGPVVTSNTKYTTESSTSSRTVHLSTGGTGTVDLPVSSTTGTHEFWIKGPQGEIHVWLDKDYISVSRGMVVTLIYYGQTLVAYIVHDTREEFISDYSLGQLTGKPSFLTTLGQTFFIFPVCFCVPWAIIKTVGLAIIPSVIARYTFLPIMAALYILVAFACVAWLLVGYPLRYFLSKLRQGIMRPKVRAQIAALRGYSR